MERKSRKKPTTLQKKERCVDTTSKQVVDIAECHNQLRKVDEGKVPFRIDCRTVVMVYPHQRTPEYAALLREKFERNRMSFKSDDVLL